jgi:hypothetical protein
MACVTTVTYYVKFNGTLLEVFSPSQGLRQGDPLSPFLFLFVADGLSTLLKNEMDRNRITPLKVCRGAPGISHLLCWFKYSSKSLLGKNLAGCCTAESEDICLEGGVKCSSY